MGGSRSTRREPACTFHRQISFPSDYAWQLVNQYNGIKWLQSTPSQPPTSLKFCLHVNASRMIIRCYDTTKSVRPNFGFLVNYVTSRSGAGSSLELQLSRFGDENVLCITLPPAAHLLSLQHTCCPAVAVPHSLRLGAGNIDWLSAGKDGGAEERRRPECKIFRSV